MGSPYKWPKKWLTRVIFTPINGVVTVLITGRGALLVGKIGSSNYYRWDIFDSYKNLLHNTHRYH